MRLVLAGLLLTAWGFAGAQQATQNESSARMAEIQQLKAELQQISARLSLLEKTEASQGIVAAPVTARSTPSASSSAPSSAVLASASTSAAAPVSPTAEAGAATFLPGTTLNFGVDGYYAYNFNEPIGRVNQLRAYDVSSNSFSLNQATLMVERLPVAEAGKRVGGRIDLQFGQATETLQGSSANELRPQVWRNLFQAYGSYLAPVGSGLDLDFGKWSSALGVEGNYSKDQINYSRSYLFDYLPFYHMGLRANYNVTSKVNVAYWLVNGAQQTEDFNGFKSQAFLFTLKPANTVTWNVNYYFGEEQRDVVATTNGALPTQNISPAPNGREHIFDSYATWNATPKLTFVGEADFVVNRVTSTSQPARVATGALYAKYALPHDYNLGARTEYVDDRGGLFSGTTQALKEFTFTFDHQIEPGFIARAEYRRDFSNQRFFTTDTAGTFVKAQPTMTLGLMYWWGQKQGSW